MSGKNEENVVLGMVNLIDFLNAEFDDKAQVLGPTVPFIPYEGDNFLRTALVKFKDYKVAHEILKKAISLYSGKSQIKLTINIDPYNF